MVDAFSHEAFLYGDLAEFLDETCGFVREGLERDEAVLVATGGDRLTGLRSFFGTEPDVQLVEMSEVGANPARIIPVWRQFLDEHEAAGRSVRGIGEPIWAGRTEAELAECHQHESLLNLAFGAGPGWRLLCPYDVTRLPEDVIEEARANHPLVLDGGRWSASDIYHPERAGRALRYRPLPPAPTGAFELAFAVGDLAAVRRVVEQFSLAHGLAETSTDDLVLCVDEMASNSLLHGGGDGVLRMWREPTDVICEISDAGSIADPLVGRENPAPDRLGGRGLWMANQLCDLVQVRSGASGTVVRLHVHLG
jgi:anti-sigma regulatory factor (Ser/Thr protein kinase)